MLYLTLADISKGPDWLPYAVGGLLAVLSVILLSGKGSWLIPGYNIASKEKKAMFDKKKLCRVVGGGLSVIALVLLLMTIFARVIPAPFTGIFFIIIVVTIGIIEVLIHSICKIEKEESTEETL